MAERIRLGLVGAGWPAWQHIKGYGRIEDVEVAALCDSDEARLQEIGKEYKIPHRYSAFEEMLEKESLDAISVCTPNVLHADMTIRALEKGLHVLCEKPMASSSAMAREMVKKQKETGKILMVGYHRRFGADARFLKAYIDRGEMGELYFARAWWVRRAGIPGMGGWFTNKQMSGGGALIDIGVHILDLGLWFFGYPEIKNLSSSWGSRFGVKGEGSWDEIPGNKKGDPCFDVDDYALAHMTFGNGKSLFLQCSWASHIKEEEAGIEIWGDKCGATLEPLQIFTTRKGVLEDRVPKMTDKNHFDEETRHFIHCIRTGETPISPAEDGLKTMEVIERIYQEGGTR